MATLTIEAGAEVYFDAAYSIIVNGELVADGTSSSYILFTSNEGTPAAGDWGTIQLNSYMGMSMSSISYSIIKYADKGITDARSIGLSYNYITDNDYGIYANDANPTIEYNTIVNSTYNGVDWTQSTPIAAMGRIYGNDISDNGGKGINLIQNAAPPVGYNTIDSNNYGIYSVKSCPDIYLNTISDNTLAGVYVEDYTTSNVQIRNNNEITGNAYGIYALRAKMLIWDNTVSSNTQGIVLDYSPSKTENNTINSNSNFGIWTYKSNQTIYNNNLTDNGGYGIRSKFWWDTNPPGQDDTAFFQTVQDIQNNTITSDVSATGIMIENANLIIINNTISWFDTSFQKGLNLWWTNGTIVNNSIEDNTIGVFTCYYGPVITGNNIANNVDYGVQNGDSTVTIVATLNWWDHASGPYNPNTNPSGQGDTVSDYVTYSPWLTGAAF
jgi:parallel beta-helix repeat protein